MTTMCYFHSRVSMTTTVWTCTPIAWPVHWPDCHFETFLYTQNPFSLCKCVSSNIHIIHQIKTLILKILVMYLLSICSLQQQQNRVTSQSSRMLSHDTTKTTTWVWSLTGSLHTRPIISHWLIYFRQREHVRVTWFLIMFQTEVDISHLKLLFDQSLVSICVTWGQGMWTTSRVKRLGCYMLVFMTMERDIKSAKSCVCVWVCVLTPWPFINSEMFPTLFGSKLIQVRHLSITTSSTTSELFIQMTEPSPDDCDKTNNSLCWVSYSSAWPVIPEFHTNEQAGKGYLWHWYTRTTGTVGTMFLEVVKTELLNTH